MAKLLQLLILHCTATPEGRPVSRQTIINWHTLPMPRGRGWKVPGYSEMIHIDGTLEEVHPYNDDAFVDAWEITNGAAGVNGIARHIVYVGGVDANIKPKDTRTAEQLKTMEMYIKAHLTIHPNIKIAGHYHFAAKACPCFNVEAWLLSIGVPAKNIYRKK